MRLSKGSLKEFSKEVFKGTSKGACLRDASGGISK